MKNDSKGSSPLQPAITASRSRTPVVSSARVIIYAPAENVNESKMQAIRDLGAEVRYHGRDFDEARQECERVAAEKGFVTFTRRMNRN